jgi:glycosidase
MTVFGEVTANSVPGSAYFVKNNMITGYKHNADGVTDYPLWSALLSGMKDNFAWTNGMNKLYMTLAQDLLYKDPSHNCIFLDNHDQDRVYSMIGEDYKQFKMGINWLLTLRGIPQMYYGTEILMTGIKKPTDAQVRKDFPGGWAGDPINKFDAKNITGLEDSAFTYVSTLAHFRKNSSALATGKTMQYLPVDGVYIYFRYDKQQTIMVISNSSDKTVNINVDRFKERTTGFSKIKNIFTGNIISLSEVVVEAKGSDVYELLK